MPPDRLRSIVPMFGGATSYVDTLDAILEFVKTHEPTTDELVGWHRGTFEGVSSRNSIQRRLDYLEDVGLLEMEDDHWQLGSEGGRYLTDQSDQTLTEIMCRRNIGLRSLLYALQGVPMTIKEVTEFQLDTHPELGWNPSNHDMSKQRTNWLRSLGLLEKEGDRYSLTGEGHEFVDDAIQNRSSTDTATLPEIVEAADASTYETTTYARVLDPEFRVTVLARYESTCPISGVDHRDLLDVAHVLSWNDHPDHRADLSNVLALSKTHHAAFDRELFTIDHEYKIRVSPSLETESEVLQSTIIDQAGETIPIPDGHLDSRHLERHNESIEWLSV